MYKKIIASFAFLFIAYFCYSQNITEILNKAKTSIEKKDYYEANLLLSDIVEKDSTNTEILNNYAFCLMKLNNNKDAELYFNKSLAINDNCAFCYAALAKIYYEFDIKKAEEYLSKAEKINVSESLIYYVKALIKRKNKDSNAAISEFSRAIYFSPKEIDYLFERANTYLQIGKADEAINDYNTILNINNSNSIVLYYLSYTYLQKKDLKNAEIFINKAIELDTTVADYYNLKFSILYNKNDLYNAEDALLKSMEINPKDINVYINLGDLYFQTGKYDSFCTAYNYALSIMNDEEKKQHQDIAEKVNKYCDESSLSYYFMRSQADFLSQNYEKSLEYAIKGLNISNKNSLLYNQKSSSLLAQKKYLEAEIETNNSINYQNNLGEEIKEFYAIELTPEQIAQITNSYKVKYQLQKAILETIRKEYDKSLTSINLALELASKEKVFPGLEYIHLAASINYLALGNNTLALQSLNTAQKINPRNPVSVLFSAYYLLLSSCSYNQNEVKYDYVEDLKLARIVFPTLTLKAEYKSNLQDAILICDKLIEKYPNNPFTYLIKAKASELLGIPDYCTEAKKGKEKGLSNIYEELGIKCE